MCSLRLAWLKQATIRVHAKNQIDDVKSMKNMKLILAMVGAAAMLATASAYAVGLTVTFVEPADGGGNVAVTWSAGWGAGTLGFPTVEGATFIGRDGTLANAQSAAGLILYWEDASKTILSDYITLSLVGGGLAQATWTLGLVSDTDGTVLTTGAGIDVIESPGIMNTPVTLTTQDGTQMSINVQLQSDPVPDGGLTAMLLGMGLLGLGWVRRMVK
jgi:hypothetical protein